MAAKILLFETKRGIVSLESDIRAMIPGANPEEVDACMVMAEDFGRTEYLNRVIAGELKKGLLTLEQHIRILELLANLANLCRSQREYKAMAAAA